MKRIIALLGLLLCVSTSCAAELILPQNRGAFYVTEPIELAVAGLAKDATASVELTPQKPGAAPVKFTAKGDGSTVVYVLAGGSLTPNLYAVKLDGKEAARITVAFDAKRSSLLVSSTSVRPPDGGANFMLGNAFSFGLLDPQGQPALDVRNKRSPGMNVFDQAVAAGLPTAVYMYWTGYVTHKPFGDEKSWASPDMTEAMRLLSFHTAQRLRKYEKNILSVGPIDEPGLSWGKTPAGGMASGFPNWNETEWYAKRGWKLTPDIANQSDADWLKYVRIRCDIIADQYRQAKQDIKSVWPKATFSGDLYALHAIMDGTEGLNQRVNDIPASHVFFDFMGGPAGATGQIYLEKCHDPTALMAHAMNGQLIGAPPVEKRPLYHLLMNQMLAGGIESNWWLNTGVLSKEDHAAVNEPAERLGPLFQAMNSKEHDVAILWSFAELAMRQKEVAARVAKRKEGEQLKLLVPLPDKSEVAIDLNPYEVGEVYTRQVLDHHQSLRRAGYPAHILHEQLVAEGRLKTYKTLFVVGQKFELPADVRKGIDDFIKAGGKLIVDPSTKLKFDGAILCETEFTPDKFRARRALDDKHAKAAKNKRDASRFETSNHFNEIHRKAAPILKAVMAKTASKPVFVSDDPDLLAERFTGGDGMLLMVTNVHEKTLAEWAEGTPLPRYNLASAKTTFTLRGIPKGSQVFCLEGFDWKKVSRLEKPDQALTAEFAPGEMKLYVVYSPKPNEFAEGWAMQGKSSLELATTLIYSHNLTGRFAAPYAITVTGKDGRELQRLYRSTGVNGSLQVRLRLGSNVAKEDLKIRFFCPLEDLGDERKVDYQKLKFAVDVVPGPTRVFDEEAIAAFLAAKPPLVIALGNASQKPLADDLAAKLNAKGIKAIVKPESEVLKKVAYPRVWDPYARLYKAEGEAGKVPGPIKNEIALGLNAKGELEARDKNGKTIDDWHKPSTLVTIVGEGYLDWQGAHEFAYEPGCRIFIDDKNQQSVVKGTLTQVKTTEEFRRKWAKPWQRLTSPVGGYQLPPGLPEAWTTDSHLILLGDSASGTTVAALQASELLPQTVDAKYPGPGKALVMFAWSPFAVEKNVIFIGAGDEAGVKAGIAKVLEMVK